MLKVIRTVSKPPNQSLKKFKARFLARGGRYDAVAGDGRLRNVLIEFDSFDQGLDCFNAPEYQLLVAIRQRCSDGEIVIVEGVE